MRYCNLLRDRYFSPSIQQLGILIGLASLSAFYIGLILAYAFRIEGDSSWQKFHVPQLLWLSTALIVTSQLLVEAGKHSLRRALVAKYRMRLAGAVLLGLAFLSLQVTAGVDLLNQGVGTTANPHGAAFYVFMGLHATHLIAGLIWLGYVYHRSRNLQTATENDLRKHRILVSVASMYWHFMGGLWIVLYFFLLRWTS